jgi:hypothetical protein
MLEIVGHTLGLRYRPCHPGVKIYSVAGWEELEPRYLTRRLVPMPPFLLQHTHHHLRWVASLAPKDVHDM